jgi:hypothetical protein
VTPKNKGRGPCFPLTLYLRPAYNNLDLMVDKTPTAVALMHVRIEHLRECCT